MSSFNQIVTGDLFFYADKINIAHSSLYDYNNTMQGNFKYR